MTDDIPPQLIEQYRAAQERAAREQACAEAVRKTLAEFGCQIAVTYTLDSQAGISASWRITAKVVQ